MGGYTSNFILISFLPLLLLFLVLLHVPVHALDGVCANVDCGMGTCVPHSGSVLEYDCVCYPGWKKFQIFNLTFPSCVIPNCTLDLQCGNSTAPSPPPPPPPPFNLFSPCNLVWCGDGTCIANGTQHYCQCNEGSANLLGLSGFPCFKEWLTVIGSPGVDCSGFHLRLGSPVTPPPPPPNGMLPPPPSPPPPRPPPPNGSDKISKSLRSYGFYMVLPYAIILASIM